MTDGEGPKQIVYLPSQNGHGLVMECSTRIESPGLSGIGSPLPPTSAHVSRAKFDILPFSPPMLADLGIVVA